MKTAIELADDANNLVLWLERRCYLGPASDVKSYAAMLRQQAEQQSAWLAANGPGGWIDDLRNKCEALEIVNTALKADAERYTKLLERTKSPIPLVRVQMMTRGQYVLRSGEELTAAIDAMKVNHES